MKAMLPALVLLCICHIGYAQEKTLAPDDRLSAVSFVIKNFGLRVSGSFSGLEGTIRFDPDNAAQAVFDVSVKAAAINTGNKKRDNHLRSNDFFDAEKFPLIHIKGAHPQPGSDGHSYVLKATLEMHGVSGQVAIPFTVKEGEAWVFEGGFTVNRLSYKVGGSSLTMADEAKVSLKIYAR
ncbi:MAG: YceI family protein [Flavihumibacter sp.]